jgi:uncharacterized LabA/DUF88 family protein
MVLTVHKKRLMIIFVDYDNINYNITRHGIIHVVNKILSKITPSEMDSNKRVTIRLYGGWYNQQNFTPKAQNLVSEIISSFPTTSKLSDNSTTVIVNCEMAYSILADPTNHLFATYRPRGVPSGLCAKHPSNSGCTNNNCPIVYTYSFIQNDICLMCNNIKPRDIFFRGEQKLVDTMLTTDLIFSTQISENVAIVTSDDDFWPGIKTSIFFGKKIIHIHTKHRQTPMYYTKTTRSNYIQKQL